MIFGSEVADFSTKNINCSLPVDLVQPVVLVRTFFRLNVKKKGLTPDVGSLKIERDVEVVKSSQVANFQIGTNKCANAKSPAQQNRKNAASGVLIEAEVAWSSSGIRHRLG